MKIRTNSYCEDKHPECGDEHELDYYVQDKLTVQRRGQLESVESTVDSCVRAIAKLITHLAGSDLLTAEQVQDIVGGYQAYVAFIED
jgi:hypothetical protein